VSSKDEAEGSPEGRCKAIGTLYRELEEYKDTAIPTYHPRYTISYHNGWGIKDLKSLGNEEVRMTAQLPDLDKLGTLEGYTTKRDHEKSTNKAKSWREMYEKLKDTMRSTATARYP
jgi:hypothetical protein